MHGIADKMLNITQVAARSNSSAGKCAVPKVAFFKERT